MADAIQADNGKPEAGVGLVGMDKDTSSYCLKELPQWLLVDVQHTDALSATEYAATRSKLARPISMAPC